MEKRMYGHLGLHKKCPAHTLCPPMTENYYACKCCCWVGPYTSSRSLNCQISCPWIPPAPFDIHMKNTNKRNGDNEYKHIWGNGPD